VEQFRARFGLHGGQQAANKAEQSLDTQAAIRPPGDQVGSRLDPEARIAQGRQALRERYEAKKQTRQSAVVPEPVKEQEKAVEKKPEHELEIRRERGLGHGR